jgi:hypothetical protein
MQLVAWITRKKANDTDIENLADVEFQRVLPCMFLRYVRMNWVKIQPSIIVRRRKILKHISKFLWIFILLVFTIIITLPAYVLHLEWYFSSKKYIKIYYINKLCFLAYMRLENYCSKHMVIVLCNGTHLQVAHMAPSLAPFLTFQQLPFG